MVSVALSMTVSQATAQQRRQGFILDLGLGVATTNTTVSTDGIEGEPERNTGLGFEGVRAEVDDIDRADGYSGTGFSLGGGYEFASHWLVDVAAIVTRPKHDRGTVTDTYETTTWRVALVWLLY